MDGARSVWRQGEERGGGRARSAAGAIVGSGMNAGAMGAAMARVRVTKTEEHSGAVRDRRKWWGLGAEASEVGSWEKAGKRRGGKRSPRMGRDV